MTLHGFTNVAFLLLVHNIATGMIVPWAVRAGAAAEGLSLRTGAGAGVSALGSLTVGAPPAIPVWVGWMIGLSPLIGIAFFGWWNLGYLRRLRAEARRL